MCAGPSASRQERMLGSRYKKAIRPKLHEAQGFRCFYCRRAMPDNAATIEHVIPSADGGDDSEGNLVVACQWCNCVRARMDHEKFKRVIEALVRGGACLGPVDWLNRMAELQQRRKGAAARKRKRAKAGA